MQPGTISCCPTCQQHPVLSPRLGELDERICEHCNGRFLPEPAVKTLVEDCRGISARTLHELSKHFGGRVIPCPGCGLNMSGIRLCGMAMEWCQHCGGLWLDHGEFARLSGGRYQEAVREPEFHYYLEELMPGWELHNGPDGLVRIHLPPFTDGPRIKVCITVAVVGVLMMTLGPPSLFVLAIVMVCLACNAMPRLPLRGGVWAFEAWPGKLTVHYGPMALRRYRTWEGECTFTWHLRERRKGPTCFLYVSTGTHKTLLWKGSSEREIASLGGKLSRVTGWRLKLQTGWRWWLPAAWQ